MFNSIEDKFLVNYYNMVSMGTMPLGIELLAPSYFYEKLNEKAGFHFLIKIYEQIPSIEVNYHDGWKT